MGGNWKSFYQQKFLDGKILQFFFFGLSVSMKFLYLGIVKKKNEKEIFIAVLLKNLNFFIQWILHKNYKTVFFCTVTCKYMSQTVVNGAAYTTRKWTGIFVLNANLSAVNARAIWMAKH